MTKPSRADHLTAGVSQLLTVGEAVTIAVCSAQLLRPLITIPFEVLCRDSRHGSGFFILQRVCHPSSRKQQHLEHLLEDEAAPAARDQVVCIRYSDMLAWSLCSSWCRVKVTRLSESVSFSSPLRRYVAHTPDCPPIDNGQAGELVCESGEGQHRVDHGSGDQQ